MNFNSIIRSFTIRTRMIGAVVLVAAALLLVGAVGFAGQTYSNSVSMSFFSGEFSAMQRIAALRTAMHELRLHEKDMIVQYEAPSKFVKARDAWAETFAKVEKDGKSLANSLQDGAQAEKANNAMGQLATFKERFAPVMKQLESQSFDTGRAAHVMVSRMQVDYNAALATVESLAEDINASAANGQQTLQASGRLVTMLLLGTIGVLLLVILPLTLINMRSICKPLDEAEALARAISEGDLGDRPVDTRGKDEAARLLQALAGMRQSLSEIIRQVRTSTDSIGTASSEIASGNNDLSSRTEQTASNLQQTAGSMEQLTGAVKQSADSARQANQLAASAAEVAQRGGGVVSQVITTMNDINTSSKKIADIIGVIDGIAFQTNILALNAAVEAARAGEQGRGFAVVASEVRSLAGRSAEAAKEIKTLIGASVDKVETGSRLVADAGSTMSEIVGSVQRVTDIIGEITAASSEQSDGIGQVNTAVTQLDQMTQQNAALVEQSAAAAESLKGQAAHLARVIATFKLAPHESNPAETQP